MVTPQMIKELRDETGAGFMDVKKALEEASGNLDAARTILREKGAVIASKRADREANQGIIATAVSSDGTKGTMIDLRCETDFVARNDDFIALANDMIGKAPGASSVEELLDQASSAAGETIGQALERIMGKIGEKIELKRVVQVGDGSGLVDAYLHHNKKVGVLVHMTGSADSSVLRETAHEVGIQLAAFPAQYLHREDVPQNVIDSELEIETQRAINEGKPAEQAAKIAQGRLEKAFYQANVLIEQPYFRDPSIKIKDLVKKAGEDAKIKQFVRFGVGE